MKMRKPVNTALALLLTLALALTVAGCSAKTSESANGASVPSTQTTSESMDKSVNDCCKDKAASTQGSGGSVNDSAK